MFPTFYLAALSALIVGRFDLHSIVCRPYPCASSYAAVVQFYTPTACTKFALRWSASTGQALKVGPYGVTCVLPVKSPGSRGRAIGPHAGIGEYFRSLAAGGFHR